MLHRLMLLFLFSCACFGTPTRTPFKALPIVPPIQEPKAPAAKPQDFKVLCPNIDSGCIAFAQRLLNKWETEWAEVGNQWTIAFRISEGDLTEIEILGIKSYPAKVTQYVRSRNKVRVNWMSEPFTEMLIEQIGIFIHRPFPPLQLPAYKLK